MVSSSVHKSNLTVNFVTVTDSLADGLSTDVLSESGFAEPVELPGLSEHPTENAAKHTKSKLNKISETRFFINFLLEIMLTKQILYVSGDIVARPCYFVYIKTASPYVKT